MNPTDLTRASWRTSSYSSANGQCVEIAQGPGWTAVRHSKHPTGPTLLFTTTEWAAFLAGAKDGEFDHQAPLEP